MEDQHWGIRPLLVTALLLAVHSQQITSEIISSVRMDRTKLDGHQSTNETRTNMFSDGFDYSVLMKTKPGMTPWDYGNLFEQWIASQQNISDEDTQLLWSIFHGEGFNISIATHEGGLSRIVQKFIQQHGHTNSLLEAMIENEDLSSSRGNNSEFHQSDHSAAFYHTYGQPRRQPMRSSKYKAEQLGSLLKERVDALRRTPDQKLELVFLVDGSSTIGRSNFENELKFVRKLLIDFTVDRFRTRVAVVTFSSQDRVVRHVDHLSYDSNDHNKCSLLEKELPKIRYTGGATDTLGAFMEAEYILSNARTDARRAIFLVTDGYSNFGDPRPLAAKLRSEGVEIFSIGIMQGNTDELFALASFPKNEHAYLLETFDEFEALARRALHTDLPPGDYVPQRLKMCDNLCSERSMCCDEHATCRCGTHTGKYECICKPGFYGVGLKKQCHACPSGTYKEYAIPGDINTCKKCPDINHVSPSGSISVSACVCKSGYRSTGSNQCAAMRCPQLNPPENGYFVQKCDNVFNAGCGIRCDTGYKLVGNSVRLCLENGTWSGQETFCQVRRCPALRAPKNGSIACTSSDYTFGTTCQFTCDVGFQRVGSAERSCLSIEHWDGITPRCREVRCKPLPKLIDGNVLIPDCTRRSMPVNMTCTLRCNSGYKMAGHNRKMCMPNGEWAPKEGAENKCIDIRPPIFVCPGAMTVPTAPDEGEALVSWTVPTAIDNSGFLPVVTVAPVKTPPARLPIGTTTLTYTAEDRAGNRGKCALVITVTDIHPPRVHRCVSPRPVISKGDPVYVTWDEPIFSDNSNETLHITRSHEPGIFPPGITMVTYTATDKYGNNNTCNIRINVQDNACAKPDNPANGVASCSAARSQLHCQLRCNPGYGFAIPPAVRYVCDFNTGYWLPANKWPFPDCSVSRISNHVTQFNNVILHASTPCADRVHFTQIKTNFIHTVTNRIRNLCEPNIQCDVHNPYAECEPRVFVKKEDIQIDFSEESFLEVESTSNNLGTLPHGHAHSVRTAPAAEESIIKVHFEIKGMVRMDDHSSSDPVQIQERLIETVNDVVLKLSDAASRGDFDVLASDEPVKVKAMSIEASDPEFECMPGSVLQNDRCVNCPAGTFYNVITKECESCPVGTYQPREDQVTCLVCPTNTSTSTNNSKSVTQCTAQCLPGTFSEDGLERCETCPVGFYQPEYAQVSCTSCPGGNTTRRRGIRTKESCAALCPAGYVSHSGLALRNDPCLACPRGYFQPNRGSKSCFLCPGGVRTQNKSSTSVADCEGITEEDIEDNKSIPIQELVINECFAEPCQNGATCESLVVGYVCQCAGGWTGLYCEYEIDECLSNPCQFNSTCNDHLNKYSCVCAPGFTGLNCDINFDDCSSHPCVNNATCEDGVNLYRCACADGYDGTNCENNIDECISDPCQNGGVCLDHVGLYECTCPPGYQGYHCEVDIDECEGSPCLNEGICIDDINAFLCDCVEGYVGDTCQEEVDECESSPCHNGATCLDTINNYSCQCLPSFSGVNCETKLNSSFHMTWSDVAMRGYLRLECCQANLTEVTIAFWIRTNDKSNFGTPISYATATQDNELSLTDYNGFTLYVHGQNRVTDVETTDGRWHHIAVTWSSAHGEWTIYKDGELQDYGDGLAKGEIIEGGGVFIVGQDQDGLGQTFNTREAFIGTLGRLNIWAEQLTAERILALTVSCTDDDVGSLVAWPDFLAETHGNMVQTESLFCKDCEPPHPIAFGNVTFNGTTSESSYASYTCDLGHRLIGQNIRKCLITTEWEGNSPQCKKKTCPFPDTIPNGSVHPRYIRFGATIRYHCRSGFRMVGNASRYCNADGVWEGAIPQCEEINCEVPAVVQPLSLRDNSERSRYGPGDKLRLKCDQGYRMEGRASLTCGEDGFWDNDLPDCQQMFCSEAPSISNGRVTKPLTVYPVDSDITYVCKSGYYMDGPATIHCQAQGSWEAFRPRCRQITCVPPPDIPHGRIALIDVDKLYPVGARVTYNCSKGFQINGQVTLACNELGMWNASTPTCEKVSCPDPEPPKNGSVTALSNRFRDIATYLCDDGYTLKGPNQRFCTALRRWSGQRPQCQAINCGEPGVVEHGSVVGSDYTFRQSVTYRCDAGYVLEGLAERVCGVNGTWINPLPTCRPVECPTPRTVPHGHYVGTAFLFGSTIEYTCHVGFVLVGNAVRRCLQDGSWNSDSPFCERVKCSAPKAVDALLVNKPQHEYTPGTVVKYSCIVGYKLVGKSTRTCRADGTWTGPKPKCKAVTCKRPNDIAYGTVKYSNMKYGSMADYSCTRGYQLDGPVARMCSADSTWSGSEPSCQAVTCPKPETISHGRLAAESFAVGADVVYNCDVGYRLAGTDRRTCLENQTWSNEAPWCQAVECVKPFPIIPHGRMVSTNFTYGSTISYVCDSGYDIDGPTTRTCNRDGVWNSSIPICQRVSCPRPLAPPNSIVEGVDFRYKEEVIYTCNTGYEIVGEARRQCRADKTWSGQVPNCIRIVCPEPTPIENGRVHRQGRHYRDEINYECERGYYIVGDYTLSCQSDKNWSGRAPRCEQVQCTAPPDIPHGVVLNDIHNVHFGDIIQYRCDEGYVLSNASNLTCSADGAYVGQVPLCVPIKCRPPQQTNNADIVGSVEGRSRRRGYGDMIEYVCHAGYDIQGDKYRRCNIHGEWSGRPPQCIPIRCPPPNPLAGGVFNSSGELLFGQRIFYACNEGFVLSGNKVRSCNADRSWTGSDPACVKIQCSYPEVDFGFVSLGSDLVRDRNVYAFLFNYETSEKYDYDEEVTITCESGYRIEGNADIKCAEDAMWKPGLPKCVPVKCPPPRIPHGVVSPSEAVPFYSEVTISCLEGYRLVGQSTVACPSSGEWDEDLPECILVTCEAPEFSNGNMTVVRSPNRGSGYPYGMTIKFSCDVGYTMQGDNTITCQNDGRWSHAIPRCEEILCERPDFKSETRTVVLTYGRRFHRGQNITMGCLQGYELSGPSSLRCGPAGRWLGAVPMCTVALCSAPTFTNGKIYSRGGRLMHKIPTGSIATFRCNKGFSIVGRRELVCLTNKTWSGELPLCESVRCQDIEINNGRVISARGSSPYFLYGMKALFTCRDGYALAGAGELRCGPNGRWSNEAPRCERVSCPVPEIEHGRLRSDLLKSPYYYSDQVSLECDEGFSPADTASGIVCRSDGSWSIKSPRCIIGHCPTPVITNGRVMTVHPDKRQTEGTNVFGQTVRFTCNEGYKLRGIDFAVCEANGTWSRDIARCEIILCPQLIVQNGRIANARSASLSLGSRVRIQCLSGYEVHGGNELVCTGDGEWQGAKPICVPKECPTPVVSHGRILGNAREDRYSFGDSIRIVCEDGYELVGEGEMVCQANRAWSVQFPPRCDQIMCPPFPAVENAEINVLSEPEESRRTDIQVEVSNHISHYMKYGTSIHVDCMPGYQLDGDSRLTCGSTKEWMGTVPKCREMACPPISIDNAKVVGQPTGRGGLWLLNNVATVICKEGYVLQNDRFANLTCLENRTWSGSFPLCLRKPCAHFSLQNGRVVGESFLFGDMVTLHCREGYGLLGPPSCRCQSNGEWDCMPFCFRTSCPRPNGIEHGSYLKTGIYFGDRLRYQCDPGYELIGEASLVCQADMQWSGEIPFCEQKTCSPPESLTNGRIVGTSYFYGDRIEYHCVEGYKLVGDRVAECQADRTWGTSPECVRITCHPPARISNGKAVGSSQYSMNDVVRYVCDEGYSSRGSIELICESSGFWRGTPPECVPVTCPPPVRTPNGFVLGNQRKYKSVVEHHCNRGFRLRGRNTQTCTANGTWSGRHPRCEIISCGSPAPLTNGHITINAYLYGSIITYGCDYGYYLDGVPSRICRENGTWSDLDPRCLPVTCPTPPRIAHGAYMGTDTKMDSLVFYMCSPEYKLEGPPQRKCLQNGNWSGYDPTCVLKECPEPAIPSHGRVEGPSRVHGSTLTFQCDPGFTLNGPPTVTCQNGDRWSKDFPQCVRISCPSPGDIEHGFYRTVSFFYEDTVTYECEEGYSMQGIPRITCQSTGFWTPTDARCVIGDCGAVPHVSFATASEPFHCDTGKCVSYVCDEGYEQEGPYVVPCGSDGQWVEPLPKCKAMSCGLPLIIHHSSTLVTDMPSGERVVEYHCNPGYILEGDSKVFCMRNGTWTFNRRPRCNPVDCGPPPVVPNSIVLSSEHTVGHFAKYSCASGFKLVGHSVIECHVDGRWNDTGPVCAGQTCPHPELVAHGFINGTDFSIGATLEYGCDKGFLLSGETNRTCRDGRWTGQPPICNIIQCPVLQHPINGALSTQLRHYNTTVTVNCNPRYQLLGNATIECLETGFWNSPLPRCSYISGPSCPDPPLPEKVLGASGPFHTGDVITLSCVEGYVAVGNMDIACTSDQMWTKFEGECRVAYCGPPLWPDPNLVVRLRGNTYSFGSQMVYHCRNGLTAATHPILTCTARGEWDNVPRCIASCKFECQNGGSCIGRNKCKCLSGYTGRFCEHAVCILQCLNGGRCTAPYHCECPFGYTGQRCQKAVCNRTCAHGGRCIRPNRCQCPRGFKPPFCEESTPVFSIDSLNQPMSR